MDRQSILNITRDKKEILKTIAENMLKLRPRSEVKLMPCYYKDGLTKKQYAGSPAEYDFKVIFPEACEGDYVYYKTIVYARKNQTVALYFDGIFEAYYDGQLVASSAERAEKVCEVDTKDGECELLIKIYAQKDNFSFTLAVSPPQYPGRWSNDYITWSRITLPIDEFRMEEGFMLSPLYKKGDKDDWNGVDRVYPPCEKEDDVVDFAKIYGVQEGKYAIALSQCAVDGKLELSNAENCDIYVNMNTAENGCDIKKGDRIVVVAKCVNQKWGFKSLSNNILKADDVLHTHRKKLNWMLLGYFDNDDVKNDISFEKVYTNSNNEKTFWRFMQEGTYPRPYIDSSFFGQWFYAIMVGHYGILNASEHLGDKYLDYFKDSIKILAKYFDYIRYEEDIFVEPPFLSKCWFLDNFDAIGSIGMNMCELYKLTKDENVSKVLKFIMNSALTKIPRLEDGTFYRHPGLMSDGRVRHVMWADDAYMSCPFFVRYGQMTGDEKYFDESIMFLTGLFKHLYMEKDGILSHIYVVDDDEQGGVPWGRGNGWVFYSMSDVLERLPDGYKGKEKLFEVYYKFLDGIVRNVGPSGMWHQVLNYHESYKETSCTAMFIAGIARGITNGWIDKEKYMPILEKAWEALAENAIDEEGNIYGVCRGSGCCSDRDYYANLLDITNDDHGTGIVMTAICELLKIK